MSDYYKAVNNAENINILKSNNLENVKKIINKNNLRGWAVDTLIQHAFKVSNEEILKYLITIDVFEVVELSKLLEIMNNRSDINCNTVYSFITSHCRTEITSATEKYNNITKISNECFNKYNNVDRIINENKKLKSEINNVTTENTKLVHNIKNTKLETQDYKSKINKLKVDNNALVHEVENSRSSLMYTRDSYERESKKLKTENMLLKEENDTKSYAILNNTKYIAENDTLKKQVTELKDQNSKLAKNATESDTAFNNLLKKRKR